MSLMRKLSFLASSLLVLSALSFVSAGSASAATPVLVAISNGNGGQEAHTCTIIGTDGDYDGVVCIDLSVQPDNGDVDSPYNAFARADLYCQTTTSAHTHVQCANVTSTIGLFDAAGGSSGDKLFACGHSPNAKCSTNTNFSVSNTINYGTNWTADNCTASTSGATDAWAVAFGGGETTIELPGSDKVVSLSVVNGNDSGNLSNGHYFLCPD